MEPIKVKHRVTNNSKTLEEHLEKLKQEAMQALTIVLRSVVSENPAANDQTVQTKFSELGKETHVEILASLQSQAESQEMMTVIQFSTSLTIRM